MGWTGIKSNRKTSAELVAFLQTEIYPNKVIRANVTLDAVYCAVNNGEYTFGMVVLYRYSGGFLDIKMMSEDMHPYYYDAKPEVLNELSKTENVHALEWRARVKETHETRIAQNWPLIADIG